MIIHTLFPSVVSESEVLISNEDVNNIINLEYRRTEDSYISQEMNILSLDIFSSLKNEIGSNIGYFLHDVCGMKKNALVEIVSSWSNIHKKGDWGHFHKHMNSVLSGVVYLKYPENSGELVFVPNTELFGPTLIFDYEKPNFLNESEHVFTPKENTLYLFPSHLRHGVMKNNSEEDRVSLAFNCFIRTDVMSEGKYFTL